MKNTNHTTKGVNSRAASNHRLLKLQDNSNIEQICFYMHQNRLFQQTRLRLALWYALVMAFILSICGFGIYRAISHAHWMTLDRELESVADRI